ncbi:hypothetical protein IV44_GL000288 [Lactobacillus amylovorus DSM 16698]|uniref:Uncharacterized protein n=1 Tax=Lactobacillus amylovorus subsp. animalium DSM 16698 TaxID=695563 RepID=A0A0R2KRI1_LACAM|nr:hypothetical protein [Lactobacillus amylovorus]KRN92233.1 hypothetical protein IV44_GL000288 [Lactobacillus amylovorus DSM 16698]
MTAEIGIINRRGIALAADSAMTVSTTNKVTVINDATKLFSLKNKNYVGMMIYQNEEFMNVPWEVIIDSFSDYMGDNVEPHLNNYVSLFLDYLNDLDIYTEQTEEQLILNNAWTALNYLPDNPQSIDEIEDALNKLQQTFHANKLIDMSVEELSQKYEKLINKVFETKYNHQANDLESLFVKTVMELITSTVMSNNYTGLIIAGYGSKDLFPSLYQLSIDGRINGQIKYKIETVDITEPKRCNTTGGIIPFAQSDVVKELISGIDPGLKNTITQQASNIINKLDQYIDSFYPSDNRMQDFKNSINSIVQQRYSYFTNYIKNNYSDPIVDFVESLSLNEMGKMAQTLVNLTSFRRKYAGDIRTVGGITKVLLISKANGPVWFNEGRVNENDYFE